MCVSGHTCPNSADSRSMYRPIASPIVGTEDDVYRGRRLRSASRGLRNQNDATPSVTGGTDCGGAPEEDVSVNPFLWGDDRFASDRQRQLRLLPPDQQLRVKREDVGIDESMDTPAPRPATRRKSSARTPSGRSTATTPHPHGTVFFRRVPNTPHPTPPQDENDENNPPPSPRRKKRRYDEGSNLGGDEKPGPVFFAPLRALKKVISSYSPSARPHHDALPEVTKPTTAMRASSNQPDFASLPNVVTAGSIIFSTDEHFGSCLNILGNNKTPNVEGEINGWLTRRRRTPGHEWCIIRLEAPCYIRGLNIDTGGLKRTDIPPYISIEGANMEDLEEELGHHLRSGSSSQPTQESVREVERLLEGHSREDRLQWGDLLAMTKLTPDIHGRNCYEIDAPEGRVYTHLRLNLFPDGGISRLYVYGEIVPNEEALMKTRSGLEGDEIVDVTSYVSGAMCLLSSEENHGLSHNLFNDKKPTSLSDCWSTARKLFRPPVYFSNDEGMLGNLPGDDWVIFKLAFPATLHSVEIDTTVCSGCAPESFVLEAVCLPDVLMSGAIEQKKYFQNNTDQIDWKTAVARTPVCAGEVQTVTNLMILFEDVATHCRFRIISDGAVARLKIKGTVQIKF
eukprot:GHVO01050211.1.p1 GENE.GHVO01050211.1~~GHVO01050211.1.p1  ORF type:complete len:623 (+),score=114.61 GHVO01050211.1:91-1959(+)